MMTNKLIIYFSKSGNTKAIAEALKELTGADIFELEPVRKYSASYSLTVIRSRLEDLFRMDVKVKEYLDSIEDYDIIYIAFPVWAATFPRIVRQQLEKLDFNGKTVRAVISHGNGGFGKSRKDIMEICKGAQIDEAFGIYDYNIKYAKRNLGEWLDNVNF